MTAKGECGLDDYKGGRWDGLHRHVALFMLAYSFLVHHRLTSAAAGGFCLRTATEPAGGASCRLALALSGHGPLVDHHQPHQDLSPTKDLTN